MNSFDVVAAALKVRELGLGDAGRVKIAKALGVSARQADKIAKHLKGEASPSTPTPVAEPKPVAAQSVSSGHFAKRHGPEELSNWRSGWTIERAPTEHTYVEDKDGSIKTTRSIHDPGISWPDGYQGARSPEDIVLAAKSARKAKRCGVIMAAQSETPVHGPAWINAYAIAMHYGADIAIAGITYKLPGAKTSKDEILPWSTTIAEFVTQDRIEIGDLVIAADYPIPPTVESPLARVESYCAMRTHIFGAARQAMRTLPSFYNGEPQFAWSTGVVTMPNYPHTAAGVEALARHHLGAILVFWDDEDRVFTRNIRFDPVTGDCFDIEIHVSGGVVRDKDEVIAERNLPRGVLNLGDPHLVWKHEPSLHAILGYGGRPADDATAIDVLDPAHVVMHDVCDFWSITPHNRRSPFQKFKRKHHGQDDLTAEIAEVGHFVRAISSPRRKVNIIKSNHDNFLARHLVETDWKNDPLNAELFLELNLATVKAVKSGDDSFEVFEHAIRVCDPAADFTYVRPTTPFRPIHYYYHIHGNDGLNGTSGSVTGFKRLGVSIVLGDKHSLTADGDVVVGGANINRPPHYQAADTLSRGFTFEHSDGFIQIVPTNGPKWRP